MDKLWDKNKSPYFVIAPMADVTDPSFRFLFAKYGKPDVMWTEFISADGLFYTAKKIGLETPQQAFKYAQDFYSQDKELKTEDFKENPFLIFLKEIVFDQSEKPIVIQLFTSNPETMKWSASFCGLLGFDGIDINMGCPDRSIEKQKSGAAMIKNPELAVEVIKACREGLDEVGKTNVPVSVKTRLGYNRDQIEEWIPTLLNSPVELITMHLRTRKEMSKVDAHWDKMKRIVELRDEINPEILIFGNGDVNSLEEGEEKIKESGCDGVMVGRGIFGNPWFFNEEVKKENLTTDEIYKVLIEHAYLFEKMLPHKSFAIMKKHFKAYVEDKDLRDKLMEANSADEVEKGVRSLF